MKKYLTICFLLCIGFVSCKQSGYDMFTTIKGIVVDSQNNAGISGATVDISPSGKNTITDNNGTFEFQDLDVQQYTITVRKQGYKTNCKNISPNAGETTEITMILTKL